MAPCVQRRKVWLTPTARVPCSNAAKMWSPLKCAGVPQIPDRSQPLVRRSSPYCGDIWRTSVTRITYLHVPRSLNYVFSKFRENPRISFWVILLETNKRRWKQYGQKLPEITRGWAHAERLRNSVSHCPYVTDCGIFTCGLIGLRKGYDPFLFHLNILLSLLCVTVANDGESRAAEMTVGITPG